MNKFFSIILIPTILYSMEYHQHRSCSLQCYPDVIQQSKFEKLKKNTHDTTLKNMYSLLSFTHSIQSLSTQKLSKFTQLLEEEYLNKKTIHHFTDLAIARIFLEKKYPHLHIGTNQLGLSNVFTDMQRIQDFIFTLYHVRNEQEQYTKLIERLYETQEKTNNRHASVNFALALSLADKKTRKKFDKLRNFKY